MTINCNNKIRMEICLPKYDPEAFGRIDVECLETAKELVLAIGTPFIRLDRWFNPHTLWYKCRLVTSPENIPGFNGEDIIKSFCKAHRIPHMSAPLRPEEKSRYILYHGCVFVNLAELGEYPRLLLIHIPQNVDYVDLHDTREIIGLSTNTIDISHVHYLCVPGSLYGSFKKEFGKQIQKVHSNLVYSDSFTKRTLYGKGTHRKSVVKLSY